MTMTRKTISISQKTKGSLLTLAWREIALLRTFFLVTLFLSALYTYGQKPQAPIAISKGGEVNITPDERGNRILDFSYCGYRQQGASIPDAPVKVFVPYKTGDQSRRIQRAIDYVSALKPDKATGLRGAVLIGEGVHELSAPLRISVSGVVIRGVSKHKTILHKTGVDRGAVVYIEGKNDLTVTDTLRVTDDYVPVGSHTLALSGGARLAEGSRLIIVRPSTKEWIESIGCEVFGGNLSYWGWKAGEMDVRWQRTVTSVTSSTLSSANIVIDAPLSVSLDKEWGGAYALAYSWPGLIHDCGVENITIEAGSLSPVDENHAWEGVYIDAAEDCWVRMADFRQLAGSAVIVQRMAQQVTVEDCRSFSPSSEIGGWRRRTFLTLGGKTLFQRCYSEEGINDFSAGYCAPGPNAFVQCEAFASHGMSGSSSSWATGILLDNMNIEGGSLSFKNLELDCWGGGWNTANSVLWECAASKVDCYDVSADARCYAVGCWGYCQGDGFWMETNNHISNPRSLFAYQLSQRIGAEAAAERCRVLMRNLDGSSSPSIQRAAEMAEEALRPRVTMSQWADEAVMTAQTSPDGVRQLPEPAVCESSAGHNAEALRIIDGSLSVGNRLMSGNLHRTPWWNGRPRYSYMDKSTYAVTRFFPGTEQHGGTDRIDSLVANISRQHVAVWNQNYGLWYDRRRDDHERVSRTDGDVWPPFYEQSIARSGQGTSCDGLSLYDLSRLNTWYYYRINQLAAAVPSMLVINQNFFQHNILEAGAHWVDSPWRSANNIQSTGKNKGRGTQFLEPVPFTGDKRIFTADLFYDTQNKERADIYRQYIWNVLDATADAPNVYQSVSEEYTGPAHFVEFWLDCIASWQQKTGRKARVVLNTTRDVALSVMSKPSYAALVDIVEIEQWYYHGRKLYAPEGGKNLAPRQHLRLTRTTNPDFADIYQTVSEAVAAFPGKAVLYYAKAFDRAPWAVVMAGGSCPSLSVADSRLSQSLLAMRPTVPSADIYRMEGASSSLIMNLSDSSIPLEKKGKAYLVNQKDGSLSPLRTGEVSKGQLVFIMR